MNTTTATHRRRETGHSPTVSPVDFGPLVPTDLEPARAYDEFSRAAAAQPRILSAGIWQDEEDTAKLVAGEFQSVPFAGESLDRQVESMTQSAMQSGTPQMVPVENVRNATICAIPISLGERRFDVLTGILVADNSDGRVAVAGLAGIASQIELWHARRRTADAENTAAATAAVLELVTRIERADDVRAACHVIADALCEHIGCESVAVGLPKKRSRHCRLIAVSGLAEVDRHSKLADEFESTFSETLLHAQLVNWPPIESGVRHSLLAHRRLADSTGNEAIVSFPLKDEDGDLHGVCLLAGERRVLQSPRTQSFLVAAGENIADALDVCERVTSSPFARRKKPGRGGRWLITLIVVACITGVLMIPTPYTISCDTVVEPVQRRFVVAPHDGLVETTLVRPGDVVREGQTVARMDDRDVRWQMTGLTAKRRQSVKRRDTKFVEGDVSASQLAELETKRIDAQMQRLAHRRAHQVIRAPIAGLVLDGRLDRVKNAPVKTGDPIYEVATIDPLIVEVAIPADDFPHARPGMTVEMRFEGRGDETVSATITDLRPRSEVKDNRNVFIAEVTIPNPGGALRPGMRGTATIRSDTHSLGWNLFHKPWERLRAKLPW